jgi:hypothetical protein
MNRQERRASREKSRHVCKITEQGIEAYEQGLPGADPVAHLLYEIAIRTSNVTKNHLSDLVLEMTDYFLSAELALSALRNGLVTMEREQPELPLLRGPRASNDQRVMNRKLHEVIRHYSVRKMDGRAYIFFKEGDLTIAKDETLIVRVIVDAFGAFFCRLEREGKRMQSVPDFTLLQAIETVRALLECGHACLSLGDIATIALHAVLDGEPIVPPIQELPLPDEWVRP